ncbi:recombinase family protein [Bacillus sp. IBL03825]|uniref:recombinase family protein n=1 Tax=Bacillus sp. IBL03825 TaxID=2953580 RepID=UPI002158173C|nr:recombinase family protein [Bacillus sp. IBL03825]MCR6846289.1 recombinase family protein [Bacillus sp. IBL03825]
MKYAVYVRVSTDRDEQVSSVQNQIDICRYWLEKNGYEWDSNAVYFDDGISGTAWLERHAMQLILEKARRNELDTVVFKSIHRLARDLRDALEIKEILIGHGIRLVTIEENYDSLYEGGNDIKFEMFAMFAAQLPKTLSVSISAAMQAKARRGEFIGKPGFGYDVVDKKLVINEKEAEVVREIFNLSKNGFGFKKIARILNDKGSYTKLGQLWSHTTIGKVLKNRKYKGDLVLNSYKTVKVDGKKKRIYTPKERLTITEDHYPAIVSKELWSAVNKDRTTSKKKTKQDMRNEFRGMLFCNHCGEPIIAKYSGKYAKKDKKEWVYMKCSNHVRFNRCVNFDPIHYDELREAIIYRLKQQEKELEIHFNPKIREKRKDKSMEIKKHIKLLKDKKEKLIDLYVEGLIDKEVFSKRDYSFENEIKEQELDLLKLMDQNKRNKEDQQIKKAFTMLEEEKDMHEVFKTLIKKITLSKDKYMEIEYTFSL